MGVIAYDGGNVRKGAQVKLSLWLLAAVAFDAILLNERTDRGGESLLQFRAGGIGGVARCRDGDPQERRRQNGARRGGNRSSGGHV